MRTRLVTAAALVLLVAAPARAQPPPLAEKPECYDPQTGAYLACTPDHVDHVGLKIAIGAMLAGTGADLTTTMYCLGAKKCTEANPLFAGLSDKPISLATIKMTVATIEALVILRIHKTHPKAATWTAVVLAAMGYATAFRNRHEMQRAR